jgi:hypothetical protein
MAALVPAVAVVRILPDKTNKFYSRRLKNEDSD